MKHQWKKFKHLGTCCTNCGQVKDASNADVACDPKALELIAPVNVREVKVDAQEEDNMADVTKTTHTA